MKTPEQVTPIDIYEKAVSLLGTDASPKDHADDELGCAETVSNILFESGCKIPEFLSTVKLCYFLNTDLAWEKTSSPTKGDIVISPTGEGGDNGISHGHTGIVMEDDKIASNDSATGLFKRNYTIASWINRYSLRGGYPVYFFRKRYSTGTPTPTLAPEDAKVVLEGLDVVKKNLDKPELRLGLLGLLKALFAFLNFKSK